MSEAKPEHLLAEYSEVCQTHRAITDFRAKLLALLPLVSGTGAYLLITKRAEPVDQTHLVAIGVFGFLVTLGLFFHELKGIKHCAEIMNRGASLEGQLKLGAGQFTKEKVYDSRWLGKVIGPVGAALLIYPMVLLAWLYLARVGATDSRGAGVVSDSAGSVVLPSQVR